MESKPDECKEYTDNVHNDAPVVCVEGATHSHATHGVIHDKIDALMADHRAAKGDKITTDQAIKDRIKSHQETFKTKCEENASRHSFINTTTRCARTN